MSLEHRTLPLLVSRSTDWAIGPLDTNVLQIYIFYVMNVRKLLKKRKYSKEKVEYCPYELRTQDPTVISTTL